MEKKGPDFYDTAHVFDTYTNHRANPLSPNETMEQPILWKLIGDPKGLNVLDLGCGEAQVAKKFRALGAKSYLGVEGSLRMFENARENIDPDFSQVQHSWLESYDPPKNAFDLVISSLVFHYLEDLEGILQKSFNALKSGGRLIFSTEHPVITSSNKSLENTALRQSWIVDDYFKRGRREVQWMGDAVTKYHRPLEDFLEILNRVGFQVQSLKEAEPPRDMFSDETLWERRRRIPLFLIIAALKKNPLLRGDI